MACLRSTAIARLLHTRHEGVYGQEKMHSNSVHQSTSSWWFTRKFLDSLRPGGPRCRMGQRTRQPPVLRKGNKISMRDGEPIPLSLLLSEMVRGQRALQLTPFRVAMSERGSRKCRTEALALAKARIFLVLLWTSRRALLVMVGAGDGGPRKLDRQPCLGVCPSRAHTGK
jgi:hypothetical protein